MATNYTLEELSELAETHFDSVKEAAEVIKRAKNRTNGAEILGDAMRAFQEQTASVNALVAEMRNEYKAYAETQAQKAAEEANLDEMFKNATQAQRKGLFEMATREFGGTAAELAMFGNKVEKALYGFYSNGTEEKDMQRKLASVNDLAMYYTATMPGGVKRSGVHKNYDGTDNKYNDSVVYDPVLFKQALSELEKQGIPYVDLYRKAAGQSIDSVSVGQGQEFVPIELSNQVVEAIFLALRVAPLFKRYTMTSPTWLMPTITSRGRAVLLAESTSATDFTPTALETRADTFNTDRLTFNAQKFASLIIYSQEIQEDSRVVLAQLVSEKANEQLAVGIEDAVINGSKANTNGGFGNYANMSSTLDNAGTTPLWTGTQDTRYAWNGIRAWVQSQCKVNANQLMSLVGLRAVRKTLGKYGIDPKLLTWIFSPNTYNDILNIDEVLRWRDVQDKATVMTGALAEIDGISILLSEYIYTNLNASGVYDSVTTTRTEGILVRTDDYAFGDRRLVRVVQVKSDLQEQTAVQVTWRGDFQKLRQPTATNPTYNPTTEAVMMNLLS